MKTIKLFLSFSLVAVLALAFTFASDLVAPLMGATDSNVMMADAALVGIFLREFVKNLFPKTEFYQFSRDDSSFISGDGGKGAKKVYIPQAGAKPKVYRGDITLPAQVEQREDDSLEYDIIPFRSQPILITNADEFFTAPEKAADVLDDHIKAINEDRAKYMLDQWAPSTANQFVRTTGSNRATALGGSATGNRKALTKADLIKIALKFEQDDVPMDRRYGLLNAEMYGDILNLSDFTDAEKFGVPGLPEGVITRILGINIMVRSSALLYDNAGTPVYKVAGTTPAAADNGGALFWDSNSVSKASTGVKVLNKDQDPTYYGDIYSAEIFAGGKYRRTDRKGVYALIEAAGA